jgi:hypothetical protein
MNLVRNSKESHQDSNNNSSNFTNNNNNGKKNKIKSKPPPITGIPTSPSRFNPSSLQTPVVTLASPFTKAQQSLQSAAAAAMFAGFWPSPFVMSPRYTAGSPSATGHANFFQFPGHNNPIGNMPRTPTNLSSLGFNLSPLLANNPYSLFDPSLFSSPSSSKTIPVHQ